MNKRIPRFYKTVHREDSFPHSIDTSHRSSQLTFDSCRLSTFDGDHTTNWERGRQILLSFYLYKARLLPKCSCELRRATRLQQTRRVHRSQIILRQALQLMWWGSAVLCMMGFCDLVLSCCRSTAQCCEYCREHVCGEWFVTINGALLFSLFYQVEPRKNTTVAIVDSRWLIVALDPSTTVELFAASPCSIVTVRATRPDRIFDFGFALTTLCAVRLSNLLGILFFDLYQYVFGGTARSLRTIAAAAHVPASIDATCPTFFEATTAVKIGLVIIRAIRIHVPIAVSNTSRCYSHLTTLPWPFGYWRDDVDVRSEIRCLFFRHCYLSAWFHAHLCCSFHRGCYSCTVALLLVSSPTSSSRCCAISDEEDVGLALGIFCHLMNLPEMIDCYHHHN